MSLKKTFEEMPEGVEPMTQAQIDAVRGGKEPGPAEMAPFPPGVREEVEASNMRRFKQEMAEKERREREEKEAAAAPKPSVAKKEAGTGVGVPAAGGAASASKTDSGLGGFQS